MNRYIRAMLLLMMIILSFIRLALSNDAWTIVGSNDRIINVQSENIAMREEVIEITLRKDHYEVDVTFDFFNSGPTEKVTLGFPVDVMDQFWKTIPGGHVYDFKSYINGEIIPQYTVNDEVLGGSADSVFDYKKHRRWFLRDVIFPANSRTVSRVTYKSKYSNDGQLSQAGYIYGTGRFWQGAIGKMTVILNHDDDIIIEWFGPSTAIGDSWVPTIKNWDIFENKRFIWEANGRYKYVIENLKPESSNDMIAIAVQSFDLDKKYARLFGWNYSDETLRFNNVNVNINFEECDPYWVWERALMYANPTDIQYYTRAQIRLFINFFFARRGYDFKNPLYREFFQKITTFGDCAGTAYKVNPNFSENDFNEFERKNIDYLLNLEKMIPK